MQVLTALVSLTSDSLGALIVHCFTAGYLRNLYHVPGVTL